MRTNEKEYDINHKIKAAEQLRRVARMEDIYDQGCVAVDEVLRAVQRYLDVESDIRELEAYYQSTAWLADIDADREGKIPKDMKRGVLSEDAIYDLLTQESSMLQMFQRVSKDSEN